MIPILPTDVSQLDVVNFYQQIVENLEMRAGHHEAWHTHKRDSLYFLTNTIEILCNVPDDTHEY